MNCTLTGFTTEQCFLCASARAYNIYAPAYVHIRTCTKTYVHANARTCESENMRTYELPCVHKSLRTHIPTRACVLECALRPFFHFESNSTQHSMITPFTSLPFCVLPYLSVRSYEKCTDRRDLHHFGEIVNFVSKSPPPT
ncbi:hypothetical protein POVWA2_048330 [Plasmodium ovale wallikeri]|uniref:Uncharacterized protein n=1 Tax=Plasmodium ovale wallikeri TaxID=864142 RepID=A0A1A8ZLA9_PLAOA|nr:hypothetical protein POVWA2_048330 [Plasmodium ovale wallikeri]